MKILIMYGKAAGVYSLPPTSLYRRA